MIPFRLNTSSRANTSASPSVTLEKGAYRMRALSNRPLGAPPRLNARPSPPNYRAVSNGTYMALLVIFLAMASLASFGAALYLFKTSKTRWETWPLQHPRERADERNQVVLYESSAHTSCPDYDPDEKFMSYFPHSGFHNQRIAFENALVLSRLINRTLLVPPIRLGNKPLRYVNFNSLQHFLVLSGKEGLSHCSRAPDYTSLPPECFDYFDYTHIPWDWLVDLTEIKVRQQLIQRWNPSDAWIHDCLRISSSQIFSLRDLQPYHFRFLDILTDTSPVNHKYTEALYIPELTQNPARLIQIGTLFGSSRLRLKSQDNIGLRGDIRRSMRFTNQRLIHIVNLIKHSLGDSYLGAHVRLGDGHFRAKGDQNARLVWWKLVHDILEFDVEEALALEREFRPSAASAYRSPPKIVPDMTARHVSPLLPNLLPRGLRCRGSRHTLTHLASLNTPLFISTDASDPMNDTIIMGFVRTFPCTFFLSDFSILTDDDMGDLRNEFDGVQLQPFLVPFLDAMVVANAWRVAGTAGSTFSRFVEDVLWRSYHGIEIVQRG